MSKDTGNTLAVKILPSVFIFWNNIHTINSGYTFRKWNAEYVWEWKTKPSVKFCGLYFCNMKTKEKGPLKWPRSLKSETETLIPLFCRAVSL